MNQNRFDFKSWQSARAAWIVSAVLGAGAAAWAAPIDVAQVPLVTSSSTLVKPNVMFILDDSGSMGWDFMPDDSNFPTTKYGRNASQCNGLAYNPSRIYKVPVDSAGVNYPLGSYTFPTATSLPNIRSVSSAAPTIATGSVTVTLATGNNSSYQTTRNTSDDNYFVTLFDNSDPTRWMIGDVTGWNSGSRTLTVNVKFTSGTGTLANARVGDGDNRPIFYTYSGTNTPLSYTYSASGVITTPTPNFYQECNADVGSLTSLFTATLVTPSFADLQNYANWYTYNRTRSLTMRTAASRAFAPIGDNYRVGFSTISSKRVSGAKFLDVAPFGVDPVSGVDHKALFYTELFGANPSGSTPLRGALSKAGRYFAKKGTKDDASNSPQTYDPVQYSCQRNYAILTTDGYWNTGSEVTGNGATSYGPDNLDRDDVGQQDGVAARPMKDSGTSTVEERTSTLRERSVTPQWTTATSTLRQRSITDQWTTATRALQQRAIVTPATSSTSTLQSRTGTLQIRTTNNGNNATPTWTAWANVTAGNQCQPDNSGNNREECQYVWTGWSNVASCTRNMSSGTGNWTIRTATDCQYSAWSAPVASASCTAVAQDTTNPYTVPVATQCTSGTFGAWTNVPSCTTSSTTQCQYAPAVNTTTTSCTAVAQSPSSPYTVGNAVQCTALPPLTGPWSSVAACTSTATNECGYTPPVNTITTSCTAIAPSTAPNYTVPTAVQCTALTPQYGAWASVSACTQSASNECGYTNWTAWSLTPSCTAAAQSVTPNYTVATGRECRTTSTGGSLDTLADVAMYYYETDLRTSTLGNCASTLDGTPTGIPTNVCVNNIGPSGLDNALHQHMTTFTLGMGVNGTLKYKADYPSATSGDFFDIKQGTKDWPLGGPSALAENIDDLWHAAVNGRGRYFSANDPTTLADSLSASLAAITASVGSGSGAAASTLQPVAGDNKLFIAKYKSGYWIGDLVARTIDPVTGVISGPIWSAATQLQAAVNANTPRNIYYATRNTGANTSVLRAFTYTNLSADGLNGNFDSACSKTVSLTQCATLTAAKVAADAAHLLAPTTATAAAKAAADAALLSVNSGSDMVDYLRGASNPVYRTRVTTDTDITGGILGDIIGGAPVYVGQPSFKYTENNYASFVAAVKATNSGTGRPGTAYAASNDGMLHAFDGATGNEKWAYIPSMVMDRMYRLADNDYAYRHEYFVNGAPVIGDIFVPGSPGTWKTILVGGLGAGGRGYYALDITDPNNPVALWEFTNDSLGGANNLGLTFGNPVITKRANGSWVVAFTSGYNNITPGDGNGHLFMVDANTGQLALDIPTYTSGTTPAGTATTPSGLGKLNAWVDSEIDNTAKRFYGGDVLGNLWRFDTDNLVAPNQAALRLAYFSAGGVPQPITTQPSLAEVKYGGSPYPVVYVGTGKYIGSTDLASTATQSVYAIKDPMTNTPLGDAHASSSVIAQTLSLPVGSTNANDPRDVTNLAVNWATDSGWRVDLITSTLPILGERVNVDMQLLYNTLTVASNIPSNDVCDAGGSSYLYQFDIGTGSIPSTLGGNVVGRFLGGSMVVGISWVTLQLPNSAAGTGRTITITVDNKGIPRTDDVPPPPPPTAAGRRTSWRELVQ